jgi:hypothetical protein
MENHHIVEQHKGFAPQMGMLNSPPLNIIFLIDSLTLLGRYWTSSVKNLPFPTRVSGLSNFSVLGPSLAHCSLPLEKDVVSPVTVTVDSKSLMYSEEVGVVYHLRNRYILILGPSIKGMGVLGKTPMPPLGGKGCDKKSHLSKAQKRELVDIAVGKKIYILGDII